jgi:multiple sugar transport system substrate-binding protein
MFKHTTLVKKASLILALVAVLALVAACAAPTAAPTQAPPTAAPAQPTAAPAQPTAAPAQPTAAPASGVKELKILWAQWDPADYLQQMGNLYEKETGIKVTIVQEPWGTFGDRFFTAMAAKSTEWDGVVGDSQWLGTGATSGYYMDMTDFLNSTGIAKTVTPATLTYYGEYPTGSGKYWGYPTEGDADGWAYRKDLFEDKANMDAFKAKYGYDLAVPKTYKELKDIAEFFTQKDKGLYGVAIYTQKDYDAITMGVENTMFPWGGSWQDANNNVMGVVNSPQNIEAVQFYKDLYDCCQAPGLSNAFFQETNDALTSGKAVMAMNYFAFFPALTNPQTNQFAAGTGFFSNPAGPKGDKGAALGGQGMSIINFISDERKQAMMDFIKWFAEEKNQSQWAALGGYTCNSKVLESETFLKAQPFNPAFAETMTFVKDFWNIPIYADLLQVTQANFHKFIVEGQGTAKETMDTIAVEQEKILKENGYIKTQ